MQIETNICSSFSHNKLFCDTLIFFKSKTKLCFINTYVGELNWVAERLTGEDTPEARARFAYGSAVMGSFTRGKGEVFTTGCTDWAYGLGDAAVARVTRNVLRRFLRR